MNSKKERSHFNTNPKKTSIASEKEWSHLSTNQKRHSNILEEKQSLNMKEKR
jgi:hypothetical protein